jgi:hypothetical protein
MSAPAPVVAEIQGLYGPFSFSEMLLQKIWWRGDFARGKAVTTDGRKVEVAHAGKWNRLGGPDFRGARLRLGDGPEMVGDVELHLRATDWQAHAHARDRAYDGVALHVVLFPPETGHVTRGVEGREIPVLALLPLLHHDLEEFAADEAVEALAGRATSRIPEELAGLGEGELAALLTTHAAARWRQKVHFARLRIARLGWEAACHHTALEILGYRFNRAPMLNVATRWPLAAWTDGNGEELAEEIWAAMAGTWAVQGVRPANHPRTRLKQYAAWTKAVPAWPTRLVEWGGKPPLPGRTAGDEGGTSGEALKTKEVRRARGFTALRGHVAEEIGGGAIGGTRLDNLMCDGFLPLLAARAGTGENAWRVLWYHWFAGDLPPVVLRGLRELGVFTGPAKPACHGAAQGLLGWLLDREARS